MARGNGHLEWESSKDEKYAEEWWTDHGFTWVLKKRFISYSRYEIHKDDMMMEYDIPSVPNMKIKKFMEGPAGFTKAWEQHMLLNRLRQEVQAGRG